MTSTRILVVDDDLGIRQTLEGVLTDEGHRVRTASTRAEALSSLRSHPADLVLLDLKMPDVTGFDLLCEIRSAAPETPIVMLTAYGTIKTAVDAIKLGASDFMTKPFNLEEVRRVIDGCCQSVDSDACRRLQSGRAPGAVPPKPIFSKMVGTSEVMRQVYDIIARVAAHDVTVLITGESGTGKELVAEAIHHNSHRGEGPLVKLNCAALPETLLESELFGHEKGAFTGAVEQRPGRFELAESGTLFLDEISSTSPSMQAKLLRVLQEGEFERVGGKHALHANVRVVAATNRDLKDLVERGLFREDLYYRLNVVPIELPPLRERRSDIGLLVHHFIGELNTAFGKSFAGISEDAMNILANYPWPGNVRELRNVLAKAMLLGDEPCIRAGDLLLGPFAAPPTTVHVPAADDPIGSHTPLSERDVIIQALQECRWNQSLAAQKLGIHRNTLRMRMDRFGVSGSRPPAGRR
jgi:DNA-binding NtrC family response regulator